MNNRDLYKVNGSESEFGIAWQPEAEEVGRFRTRPIRPQQTRRVSPKRVLPRPKKPVRSPTPRRRRRRRPLPINFRSPDFTQPEPQSQGSEYVRWVQTMLNQALNLRLPVHGMLDVQTRSAVRSFQEKNGLPVTGIVGPDTERALMGTNDGQTPEPGATQATEPGTAEPSQTTTTSPEPEPSAPAEPDSTSPAAEFEWELFNNDFAVPARERTGYSRWQQESGSIGSKTTTPSAATPQPVEVSGSNCVARIRAADAAIRKHFALAGPGLIETSTNRVRCVSESQFEKLIPAAFIPDILLNAFTEQSWGDPFGRILRHYNKALVISDDARVTAARFRKLREFVAERIKKGNFQFITVESTGGPNAQLAAITKTMSIRRVAAASLGGFTSSEANRGSRRVTIPLPNIMEILVHEGCHFYAHHNFSVAARRNTEFFRELRVSQVLIEGFCEYFARQVMRANQSTFGPIMIRAYQRHVEFADRVIETVGSDAVARKAYFAGNQGAITRILDSVRRNRNVNLDLIVP